MQDINKINHLSIIITTLSQRAAAKLHAVVSGAAATLGDHPVDVLARVLDVASLAVDAVLSVDLQPHAISLFQWHVLVHTWEKNIINYKALVESLQITILTSRTESALWSIINGKIVLHRVSVILESEMGRLVTLVVGSCQG